MLGKLSKHDNEKIKKKTTIKYLDRLQSSIKESMFIKVAIYVDRDLEDNSAKIERIREKSETKSGCKLVPTLKRLSTRYAIACVHVCAKLR